MNPRIAKGFLLALAACASSLAPLAAQEASGTERCMIFQDAGEFVEFTRLIGLFLDEAENFEETSVPAGRLQFLPAPLESGVARVVDGLGFPSGLTADALVIQDNVSPRPSPLSTEPSGEGYAILVLGEGALGAESAQIGEGLFFANASGSLDLIFPKPVRGAVGFHLSRFPGFSMAGWTITVYDTDGEILEIVDVAGPQAIAPASSFFGVWCAESIGRINVWDAGPPAPDAIDDLQIWTSIPVSIEASSWSRIKSGYSTSR